jgi:CheY-like chemotaxis protein
LPENIHIDFAPRTADAAAVADEGALQQIIFNLVTNARDAMPEGGTLHIAVSRVILDTHHSDLIEWGASGEYVVVTVTDTGEGMTEETRERIFDPFYTTKPPGVGTGLGMAMVYGLIKQQGGFIDIQSTEGEGTSVDLYFPPALGDLIEEGMTAGTATEGDETILLVEDEAAVRRSAKRLLEKKGYRVLPASDGEEALALFEAHGAEIDLVISDVIMPRVGGGQLYQSLSRRTDHVRFLFTSGYTPRDVRVSGGVDPRVPFLAKPWDVDDLLRTVRELLDART